MPWPRWLNSLLKKHDPSTSAAKACTEEKGFIAALKRCATQNHCFSANCKATVDYSAIFGAYRAAPFQDKFVDGVF
jgi:hypothetical protein